MQACLPQSAGLSKIIGKIQFFCLRGNVFQVNPSGRSSSFSRLLSSWISHGLCVAISKITYIQSHGTFVKQQQLAIVENTLRRLGMPCPGLRHFAHRHLPGRHPLLGLD